MSVASTIDNQQLITMPPRFSSPPVEALKRRDPKNPLQGPEANTAHHDNPNPLKAARVLLTSFPHVAHTAQSSPRPPYFLPPLRARSLVEVSTAATQTL